MRNIKIVALLMAVLMCVGVLAACQPGEDTSNNPNAEVSYGKVDPADAVVHKDFTSVYEMIGSKITIDMVKEDEDGMASVEYEGTTYELGLDFLSMAMVYNCQPAGDYKTAEECYNEWWKLFIQRYNYLALEIPLYSNQYFDLYNAKLEGFVTSPYWGAASAIIAATVKEGADNSVILGSATQLSGAFRNSSWGKSNPGSSDLDIEELTSGYATVQSGMDGAYQWNMKALAEEPTSVKNEDGTLTYTIKIREDMVFSDGSAINAKNYIVGVLTNATLVAMGAGGSGTSGLSFAGYDEYHAYDGSNDGVTAKDKDGNDLDYKASKYFSGIKLIDDYTFSVTLLADYADYYYSMTYAGFSPVPMALYAGEHDIIVADDKSCGMADGFWAKETKEGTEVYTMAATITENLKWDSDIPYSGPYTVEAYDDKTLTATLKLNPNYPGDDARGKASIETITYREVVSETQMDQFQKGEVDIIAGITGAAETESALKLVKENPDKYAETHYDRAGYGFIGIRCDLGPMSNTAVRQAVMYTINRNEFAQTFTGGYGSVVHGPYYEGFSAFQAKKNEIMLNQYAYSSDSAVAVLEEGGWIYNDKGQTFVAGTDAVRYKKLEGYELSVQNIQYKTTDGKYETLKINGEYYMPLAINYYGTQPNEVTDQLLTAWQTNPNATTAIGAYIVYTSCEFTGGLYGEYLQMEAYGWDGVPKCTCINYATGFTSAAYDMSWNFTINPEMYADYSRAYFMDEADFYENYTKEA